MKYNGNNNRHVCHVRNFLVIIYAHVQHTVKEMKKVRNINILKLFSNQKTISSLMFTYLWCVWCVGCEMFS